MSTTWQAQQAGNYSAPATWAKDSTTYPITAISASLKTITITGTFPAGTTQVQLYHTFGSFDDGTYTGTASGSVFTWTSTTVASPQADVTGSGYAYIPGVPGNGDTIDLNGETINVDIQPAKNLTVTDNSTGGLLELLVNMTLDTWTMTVGNSGAGPGISIATNPATITIKGVFTIGDTCQIFLNNSAAIIVVPTGASIVSATTVNNQGNILLFEHGTVQIYGSVILNTVESNLTIEAAATVIVERTGKLILNTTLNYENTSALVISNGSLKVLGQLSLDGGTTFMSSTISAIGPWPVTAQCVGPFEIGPSNLGPYAIH